MKSKYFTVEVKPVMLAADAGLNAAFGDGDVLFDWTAFQVPRGVSKLIGATVEIRPKGDTGSTVNRFPLSLLFAKTKDLVAPTTLGALNSAPAASASIGTQANRFLGTMSIAAGDFNDATDQLAVASAAAPNGLVLEPEPFSNNLTSATDKEKNPGIDLLYVGGIADGAFNFVSTCLIDNGDLNGPTMTVKDVDPRKFIAVGDTIAACDTTSTGSEIAMGVVESLGATSIVLTSAFTTGDVANEDIIYNVSPIRILLTFEK